MTLLPWFTPFLLVLVTAIGISFGGIFTWTGVFIIFLLHPILDKMIGKESKGVIFDNELELLLISYVPFQTTFLVWAIWVAYHAPNDYQFLGIIFSTGLLTGGLGITSAHELIHRAKRKHRMLGVILLSQVNYAHFRIEHVWGHHRMVGTKEDPASANLNQNLYSFLLQSFVGSYISAWKLENINYKNAKKHLIINHRMIVYHIFTLLFAAVFYYIGGTKLLIFWFGQSLVATTLLEVINYIEHYGLRRKKDAPGKYEAVAPKHSWDCTYLFTNFTLFNLGKHSHHHWKAATPYYQLQTNNDSPKLPFGYSLTLILAFFPPLWKKIMNPLIPLNK